MNLASANAVPVKMRGKVAGFFTISASLGRAIGPAGCSALLAWSLGSNKLFDYHAMFVVLMILMVVVVVLGRKALTLEALTVSIENRHLAEYESVPHLSVSSPANVSNDNLADVTIAAARGNGRPRRRDSSVVHPL